MARHIAIVEDVATIRHNYEDAQRRFGYQVTGYADKDAALAALKRRLPDLVIIDVGLGQDVEGGFDLCRELRSLSKSLPIIFLTARVSDLDVISGLRLGADDYLTKDISLQPLVARVLALFRRVEALSGGARDEQLLERGPLKFSVERMEVSWRGTPVPLTVTEFWILHSLIRHPGHVRTRAQLMDDANVLVDDQTITSHIKRIRRKFVAADLFETLSLVDLTLRQDPTRLYLGMDFETRDRYRKAVEKLAGPGPGDELTVARAAVSLAQAAASRVSSAAASRASSASVSASPGGSPFKIPKFHPSGWDGFVSQPEAHIGYYLLGHGRTLLEAAIGYAPQGTQRLRSFSRAHPTQLYLGAIACISLGLVIIPLVVALLSEASPAVLGLIFMLALVPALTMVVD